MLIQGKFITLSSNKIDKPIYVVGSRASGKASILSDWDSVIEGANSKTRRNAANLLPKGIAGGGILIKGATKVDDVADISKLSKAEKTKDLTTTQLDLIKKSRNQQNHLDSQHLEAAKRELQGEVVARRPDGTPYNHLKEVRDAQKGLRNSITKYEKALKYERWTPRARAVMEKYLDASKKVLKNSEKYVPQE